MGRPSTKPANLKDGFYLEIVNNGFTNNILIRRDSQKDIDNAIEGYKKTKDVKLLGELRKGKWVSGPGKKKK